LWFQKVPGDWASHGLRHVRIWRNTSGPTHLAFDDLPPNPIDDLLLASSPLWQRNNRPSSLDKLSDHGHHSLRTHYTFHPRGRHGHPHRRAQETRKPNLRDAPIDSIRPK